MGTIIRNVNTRKRMVNISPPEKNTNSSDDFLFKEHARDVGENKTVFFRALVGTLALKRQRVFVFAMVV